MRKNTGTPAEGEVTIFGELDAPSSTPGTERISYSVSRLVDRISLGRGRPSAATSLSVLLTRCHRSPTASGRQAEAGRPAASRKTRGLGVRSLKAPGN